MNHKPALAIVLFALGGLGMAIATAPDVQAETIISGNYTVRLGTKPGPPKIALTSSMVA